MLSWADEALTAATALGHRQFELVAAAQVAYARYSLGLPAGEDLDRAVAVLDAIDDTELAGRLDAVLWVGWAEAQLERFERGIAHCQRAIDVSRATGQGAYLLGTMSAQAWALIRVGRLAEADEVLAAAIEAFRLAPNAFLPQAVGLTSILGSYKGDLAGAVRAAEECVRLTAADPGQLRARSGLQLGTALIEMGEAERAREAVLELMGGPELPLLGRAGRCTTYEILTRAELALDRLEAAEAWAVKAEEAMYGGDLAVDAAAGHRALAAVSLARGEAPRAAGIALDAADRAEAAGGVVEAGRCRILAARALAAAGEPDRAIAELEHAAGELARIGADGYRAEAEEALRRLGRPVARRADSAGRGLRSLSASGIRTTAGRTVRGVPGVRELSPGDVFAGYRIEALAGRGGMGLVYRARQVRPERSVAVKVIMPELAGDPDFRARFELEASLAAQIEHPNVIPIYEVGDVEGLLYIVMRFVESTDLRVLLRSHQRLGAAHAARLVSQIAAALDAAHERGMVHRDVKPANVLVTGAHPDEHLYLTDFGLTKRTADIGGVTMTGSYVGTLDYIAPEQVNGDPVDGRGDVYALGCVLYELLTGAVPFPRSQEVAKMFAHLSAPPPRPSAAVPGLPGELDAVVARAMAKDPADRFPSAGELARAAVAAAGGLTPSAVGSGLPSGAGAVSIGGVTTAATRPEPDGPLPLPPIVAEVAGRRFVGRDQVLATLRAGWEESAAGERIVLVTGDAGIGKTALAARFAQEVHAAGAAVLYGRCDEEPVSS
ncbi:MAG TPA: protein kinase, partial [Solirubrobacteraceae bacterium]|nr:protein kinase [Solirubrobacteraceae bacterium]